MAELTMREPLVRDQFDAQKQGKEAAETEKYLFARLTNIPPDDLEAMTMRDYAKLQGAYANFLYAPLAKGKSDESAS